MSKRSTSELDQIVNIYRTKLKQVDDLWSQLVRHGQCDHSLMKGMNERLDHVETASMHLLDEQVIVETARFHICRLKQMLGVSRQIVEAKSNHLKTEEHQMDKERHVKYKEFQKIHKMEEDKATIENNLRTAREKMAKLLDTLSRKCIKQKYAEDFADCLTEELRKDLNEIKLQAEKAREERSVWDRFDVDVLGELKRFIIDKDEVKKLQSSVMQLKESLQNQNKWYEEELCTKLFYSSRNKEIQAKIANFKTIVKRMERSGRHQDPEDTQDKPSGMTDFSTTLMIDGVPDVHAKDVQEYLSHQFGVRVLADYSMLRRLKDEIGVLGLAYLVERIRFQDHLPSSSKPRNHRTFIDLEEKQIETALEAIAKEYRSQDEIRHQACMSSRSRASKSDDQSENGLSHSDTPRPCTAHRRQETGGVAQSSSGFSTPTGSGTAESLSGPNTPSSSSNSKKGSTASLKSKSSTSRIKRMFKF